MEKQDDYCVRRKSMSKPVEFDRFRRGETSNLEVETMAKNAAIFGDIYISTNVPFDRFPRTKNCLDKFPQTGSDYLDNLTS